MLEILLFSISIQGSGDIKYWLSDNMKENYESFIDIGINERSIQTGVRLLFDQDKLIRDTLLNTGLERFFFIYSRERFNVRAGSFYTTFLRGMLLSAYEDLDIKQERRLDGLRIRLKPVNMLNLTFIGARPYILNHLEHEDPIYAVNMELTPMSQLYLAAAYMRLDANKNADTLSGLLYEDWYGADFSYMLGFLGFDGVYVGRNTYGTYLPGEGWVGISNVNGNGLYLSMNMSLPGFGVLIDAKRYKNIDGYLTGAPPCTYNGESINQGKDEEGFEVIVDANPHEMLSFSFNYSYAQGISTDAELMELYIAPAIDFLSFNMTPYFLKIDRNKGAIENATNNEWETGLTFEGVWGSIGYTVKGYYKNIVEGVSTTNDINSLIEFDTGNFSLGTLLVYSIGEQESKLYPSLSMVLRKDVFDISLEAGLFKGQYICKNGMCRYEEAFSGLKTGLSFRF